MTVALLLSSAWIAPWAHERLAVPEAKDHQAVRESLSKVRRLAGRACITAPKLVAVEHPCPVAFGVGMPGTSRVFVTTGLIAAVNSRTM